MVMVRVPNALSIISSGTLPPMVGSLIHGPRALSTARITSCEIGKSMEVRTALYPNPCSSTLATLACARRMAAPRAGNELVNVTIGSVTATGLREATSPGGLPWLSIS